MKAPYPAKIAWSRLADMDEKAVEQCGKCGAEIDPERRVDYTLKDGTRVCEACFIKGTRKSAGRT